MGRGYSSRGCPYCDLSVVDGRAHIIRKHPEQPRPSDKGFPGWKTLLSENKGVFKTGDQIEVILRSV